MGMSTINIDLAIEKFEPFEWLAKGITAKTANYEPTVRGTAEKPLDYQDRLGAIASMDTQLEKSVTSLIIYGDLAKSDYEYIRNHLAKIMLTNAQADRKREPQGIAMYHLAWLMARKVLDFAMDPRLENAYTKYGCMYYMGIGDHQMSLKAYECTWEQYEKLMVIAIETAINGASEAIKKYKKNTFKEM